MIWGLAVAAKNGRNGAKTGGETLLAHLVASGYRRAEPAVLQPATVYLDQLGEDMRGRLYLTTDAAGVELCLRPEFTLAVSQAYLASSAAGKTAGFSYLGPVFRFRWIVWSAMAEIRGRSFTALNVAWKLIRLTVVPSLTVSVIVVEPDAFG